MSRPSKRQQAQISTLTRCIQAHMKARNYEEAQRVRKIRDEVLAKEVK